MSDRLPYDLEELDLELVLLEWHESDRRSRERRRQAAIRRRERTELAIIAAGFIVLAIALLVALLRDGPLGSFAGG